MLDDDDDDDDEDDESEISCELELEKRFAPIAAEPEIELLFTSSALLVYKC